ncbi:hypothetical protein VYU27_000219 [Nannochloropsis oceanica]
MPVHSIYILNAQDKVLFRKHLDAKWRLISHIDDRLQWERVLYRNTRNKSPALPGASQFFQEREINVVYQGFYDVVVFLAGTDECDEMTLTDLLVVVQELLCLACGGKKKISAANASVESEFLHKDGGAFAKFSIYVDHMMPHGFVASTNVDLIDKLAKGKPVV